MAISLDGVFGLHVNAVKLHSKRTEILASNISNADTPGYKARDFDFKKALADAQSSGVSASTMTVTHPGHMTASGNSGGLNFEVMYSNPMQSSIDGNTVDIHREKAKFTENSMQHQASLTFLDKKLQGMVKAIRGE